MTEAVNRAPVIIKRKKVIAGGGHHGGAWKVAYADFVTAMMAFFMLMWLLNATTEQQRKGIADYFAPTIPINRISGGGDGNFGGSNIFSEDTLARDGTGASARNHGSEAGVFPQAADRNDESLREVDDALSGLSGEALLSELEQRHIITRLTDEGLMVEVFDTAEASLFIGNTAEPTAALRDIATAIAAAFQIVINDVAVSGHTVSRPIVMVDPKVWEVSTERAAVMRKLLQDSGLAPDRFSRQTGEADRRPADANPFSVRNNRLEIILLRDDLNPERR